MPTGLPRVRNNIIEIPLDGASPSRLLHDCCDMVPAISRRLIEECRSFEDIAALFITHAFTMIVTRPHSGRYLPFTRCALADFQVCYTVIGFRLSPRGARPCIHAALNAHFAIGIAMKADISAASQFRGRLHATLEKAGPSLSKFLVLFTHATFLFLFHDHYDGLLPRAD